jgi:hypothetical protein
MLIFALLSVRASPPYANQLRAILKLSPTRGSRSIRGQFALQACCKPASKPPTWATPCERSHGVARGDAPCSVRCCRYVLQQSTSAQTACVPCWTFPPAGKLMLHSSNGTRSKYRTHSSRAAGSRAVIQACVGWARAPIACGGARIGAEDTVSCSSCVRSG